MMDCLKIRTVTQKNKEDTEADECDNEKVRTPKKRKASEGDRDESTQFLMEEIDNLKKKNTSLQEKWSEAESKRRHAEKMLEALQTTNKRLSTTALTSEQSTGNRTVRRKTRSASQQLANPVNRQTYMNNQKALQEEHEDLTTRLSQISEEMERNKTLVTDSQDAADIQTMSHFKLVDKLDMYR
jgi:prefoldin subunit 5